MKPKRKLTLVVFCVTLVCGGFCFWLWERTPEVEPSGSVDVARGALGEMRRRLDQALFSSPQRDKHEGPSKAYLPEHWRALPDDEANRRLIDLWLFAAREVDPAKRKARHDALTLALRSRGASAVLPLEAALDDVPQHDQESRKALLFALGEVAHELTWKGDKPSPEAVAQITEIAEAELAAPETIPVGEFLADWPKEALRKMMHHDGRFSETGGEIYMSTEHAKMSAVGILRQIGDEQAVARLQQIQRDTSYSQPVRNMAKVSLAILTF